MFNLPPAYLPRFSSLTEPLEMDAAGQHAAKSTIQQGVEEFENHHDDVKPVNKAERITIRDRGTFRQGNEVNIDTFNQTIQAPPASR